MKKTIRILLIATGVICIFVLLSIITKGEDPFDTFLFGLVSGLQIGLLIAYLIYSKREAKENALFISNNNISEYFDDLEDRIDLAEEFVLDSQDKGFKKQWEQIREWDKGAWEMDWEIRKKPLENKTT